MATPRPTAMGAYIFSGGFTLGVKKHFKVQCVLEAGPYGVTTMRHNQPEIPVHVGVHTWDAAISETGPVDFIYGNPPCAAWSPAGATLKREREWRTDPRVNCTRQHFDLLEIVKPKVWAWESVPQAFTTGREFVDELTERAHGLGYSVTYLLHNAMYLGCAQNRKRFFFVAHRVAFEPTAPAWDVVPCGEVLRRMNFVGELSPAAAKLDRYDDLLPLVRQGEGLRFAWDRANPNPTRKADGRIRGRPAFTIKRARADAPTGVVMNEMIHPTEHRFMTMQELAALCGFPADYEFISDGDMGQISRGVCPPVGEWLAKNVARAIRLDVAVGKPTATLVDLSKPDGYRGPAPKEDVVKKDPTPQEGEGSGAFMRRMLSEACAPEYILERVHACYPGSKATKADVSWNRNKLQKINENGVAPPFERKNTHVVTSKKGGEPIARLNTGVPVAAPQPTRSRRTNVDESREFDTTALHRGGSQERAVHRDYAAHFFRWGFAGTFCGGNKILDVGCGTDHPLVAILNHPRNLVPKAYVGVDFNKEPRKVTQRQWAKFHWGFDFTRDYKKISGGPFDVVTCFEVIEHMRPDAGARLLSGIRWNMSAEGVALLSTPVYDGKAAANHIHEWTIPELQAAIDDAGLVVDRRHGTFASWQAIKKVASREELRIAESLKKYYSGEVVSCFLAPLYPDASRNCVWVLKRNGRGR